MSVGVRLALIVAAAAAAADGAFGQLSMPPIVVLPTEDFIFPWGDPPDVDSVDRPDFTVRGVEASFSCVAMGTFRPGSRMRDFYNQRDFEQALNGSLYFIQETTLALNELDRENHLEWAILDCKLPEETDSDLSKEQQRLNKAVERAERDRERRRARQE